MGILDAEGNEQAAKSRMDMQAVKAVGDWELDILAVPFTKDSDGQWFDENTDIMNGDFQSPLGFYQHGIKQGAKAIQDKIIVIGKTIEGTLRKMADGWHLRMKLDQSRPEAANVMQAAKDGRVAVSSDSIAHLARLEVGGRSQMYDKNKPGRIAVWPLAGVSLWELGNGNLSPANRTAYAVPAIKAIYRDAGLQFPNINITDGVLPEADEAAKRARNKAIEASKNILKKTDKRF